MNGQTTLNILQNLYLICNLDSLILFQRKTTILWKMYVVGNNKTYFGLYVKCSIFLSDPKQVWIFSAYFNKGFQYKSSRKFV